jgi:hypothetical protein
MSIRRKPINLSTAAGIGVVENNVIGLAQGYTCGFSRQGPVVTRADIQKVVHNLLEKRAATPAVLSNDASMVKYCTCAHGPCTCTKDANCKCTCQMCQSRETCGM